MHICWCDCFTGPVTIPYPYMESISSKNIVAVVTKGIDEINTNRRS